jgi:hypothetical protein
MSATTARDQTAITPRKRPARTDRDKAERRLGVMLVAPAAVVMVLVSAYPIIYSFVLSLQRADLRFPHRVIFGRGPVRAIALIPYGIVTVVAAFSWRYAWEVSSSELEELAQDAGGADLMRAQEGSQVVARLAAESKVRQGEEAELWFDSERLHLFDSESGRSLLSVEEAIKPHPDGQPSPAS